MPENTPSQPAPVSQAPTALPEAPIPFHIGEEFGTAKKNLPSLKTVGIAVAVIAVIAAIYSFVQRPQSATTGSIDDLVSVEVPGQGQVMVAINVSFQNNGLKPYWIHTISASLDSASGTSNDDAASAADFERYFQAFPTLKQHAIAPLLPETKILPGGKASGTVIVAFPVTPDVFAARKQLRVIIQPYDQPVPLILTK
jgi:hypothetical protein